MGRNHPDAVSSSPPPAVLPDAGSGAVHDAAPAAFPGPAPAAVHDAAGADPFEAPVVGVGPWEGPWPGDDRYDQALLAEGDRRNVVDRYRYWKRSAIRADLAGRAHPFHVAVENWEHDFNIGAIVRTANAFGAGGVHIVGKRRWNRRGAMVTDRYLNVVHHADVAGLADWAAREGLALIAIDNLPGARPLEGARLP
ncbi:MAG: hypothetical protein LBG60_02560, partial [Bifidobacteriaceae bacterium]|nr:hypothetical protein [Bifidobacteriaceae bacterium]